MTNLVPFRKRKGPRARCQDCGGKGWRYMEYTPHGAAYPNSAVVICDCMNDNPPAPNQEEKNEH